MNDPVELHCEIRGTGSPLILIMGLGADGSVWERHVEVYERYFTCVIIDNRGVGRSPQPAGPYSTMQMAGDVAALMDRLKISRAPVCGISMGGAIAQQLARYYPDKVSRLVLVSTWAIGDAYTRMIFKHFKRVRAMVPTQDWVRLLQLWIWTPDYVESHENELREARNAVNDAPAQTRAGFEGQCDACITHDAVCVGLQKIAVPTLITVGDRDIFTPLPFSEQLHRSISGSVLSIFRGSGHAHHWEACERFNRETTAFLLGTP